MISQKVMFPRDDNFSDDELAGALEAIQKCGSKITVQATFVLQKN